MKTVIYDGSCRLCRVTIDRVKKSPAAGEFEFVDFTRDTLPSGVDLPGAKKEIHVIDEHGGVHRNADGMMEILAAGPRWRWLAALGRLPVIRTLLRWGYRLIARYRHGHRP
ncbi:MAG TPA: DUF393 domain-containing protein [Patescibacteria group bacterium]|nr:DUF393 domain-containing protein [Patescibacteria group bacterium]